MSKRSEPKNSESMYRSIVENSKDAIIVVSTSKIVYANTVTAKLCGYEKPEEIIGKDNFGFIYQRYRDQFKERIMSRLNGKTQPERFDHEIVRKDGSIVQVETTASLIKYGDSPAVLFIARDLTERNKFVSKLFDLHQYMALLGSAETITDVSEATLDSITAVMGFKLAHFMLREEDSLICVDQVGFEENYWGVPINEKERIPQAAREKKTILDNDLKDDLDLNEIQRGVHSELATPVLVKGNVEVVISVKSTDKEAFGDSDVQILEVIALHVASALERMGNSV
jgi:PAS domain S-box-containing protein